MTTPTIQASKDFEEFETHDARDPEKYKTDRLREAVQKQNLLAFYPIHVSPKDKKTKKRHIKDGVKRFYVARELDLELSFIETPDDVSPASLAMAVGLTEKWTLEDYLFYWTSENSEAHHQALLFLGKHSFMTANTAVQLLTGHARRNVGIERSCRAGVLTLTHAPWAEEIGSELIDILKCVDEGFNVTQMFIKAFIVLYTAPNFRLNRWRRRMESQATQFRSHRTIEDYFHMLRAAYNLGRAPNDCVPDTDFRRRDLVPLIRKGATLQHVENGD